MHMIFAIPLLLRVLFCNASGLSNGQILLEDGYNKNALPGQEPVTIILSTFLQNIVDVDEEKRRMSIDLSLRMFWKDDRVSLNESFLKYLEYDNIGEYFNIKALCV